MKINGTAAKNIKAYYIIMQAFSLFLSTLQFFVCSQMI